ncbi:MAG: hypothetical protein IJS60_00125 [Abditibacteriota bacterium]|nr:hypothetical protein [Abditibacteriota bacterium]
MKIAEFAKNPLKYSYKYRPSAFYFWNEDMEEDRIESMLAQMEKDQIREVLFHPVHGLTIPYLSDKFCTIYKKGLSLAKKHNLKVWIYDEYSWPTGCVAGYINKLHPEYIGWYLTIENGKAVPKRSGRVHDGTTGAPWTQSEGGYIDTLNFDAMKCFINMNYEKLKDACGKYWDDVILGFFTDEPATMMPFDEGNFWNAQALPWTEKLPYYFKKINNYDIEHFYEKLFEKEENQYKEDYFKCVKYLYCNAYHKQLGDWCKSHGKFYTGHLGEDSVHQQVRYGGSLYQSLSHMTHPGVDFLNWCDPDQKYDQEMVASVAKHSSPPGSPKNVYMEAYGISLYTLTLSEMYYKWQGFAVQRVNDIALMGMQHSTSSVRKRTYWPPITNDQPWWDYYPVFRDAASVCQGISNLGKDIRKYAIMYPQYEIEQYSSQVVKEDDAITNKINAIIDKVCSSRNQYDWVFPEIIKDAKVIDGKIVFPNETYDAIIATEEFKYFTDTQKTLNSLQNDGGNIIRDRISDITLNATVWSDLISINLDKKNRVYTYEYEDGYMIVIRNISDENSLTHISLLKDDFFLSEWEPLNGKVYKTNGKITKNLRPHSCIYISITKECITNNSYPVLKNKPININFNLKALKYNTAPFNKVCALHPDKGWINLTSVPAMETPFGKFYSEKDSSVLNNNGFPTLSKEFIGAGDINFEAEFNVEEITKIGILAESKYIKNICINSQKLENPSFVKDFIWDYSNIFIDLTDYIKVGTNKISFTLGFEPWETSIRNEAFFCHGPMPSVDVCLAGDFLFIDETIKKYDDKSKSLPLTLENEGFAYTYGKVSMTGTFTKTNDMENLYLDILGETSCEVKIDNKTIGCAISEYIFPIRDISTGDHKIEIILTGVSASLMIYNANNNFGIKGISY